MYGTYFVIFKPLQIDENGSRHSLFSMLRILDKLERNFPQNIEEERGTT